MAIRIEALGGLTIHRNGQDVPDLATMRSRVALLIFLAVEGRARRDVVMSLFWPESSVSNARHALRQALYQLRSILGEDWLVAVGDELVVTPAVVCDVSDFERAVEACDADLMLTCCRGPFLDGVHLIDNKDWETWVDDRRSAISRSHRHFCRDYVKSRMAAGEVEAAIDVARLWVKCNPLDDHGHHRLIELLALSGDRLGAIAHYDSYLRLLSREDLVPLEETAELIRRIRSQPTAPVLERPPEPVGPSEPDGPRESERRAASRSGPAETEAAFESFSGPARVSDVALPGEGQPRRRVWRSGVALILMTVALGIAGVLIAALLGRGARETQYVVFPLRNETGDPALDPLGRVAADWLTEGLIRSGLGHVRASSDTAGTGGARVIGIRGHYWRAADSLRLSLIAEEPDGSLLGAIDAATAIDEDPMRGVETARQRLLGMLAARDEERLAGVLETATPLYGAYVEYIAGLERFAKGDSVGAGAHYRRAVEIDPDFLAVRLEQASLPPRAAFGSDGWREERAVLMRSLDSSRARMTPAQRHHFKALEAGRDRRAAYEAYREAARLAPQRFLCEFALAAIDYGEYQEALDALRRADLKEGICRRYGWATMLALHHLGRFEEGLRVAREARAGGTDSDEVRREERYALAALGRVEELRANLDAMHQKVGESRTATEIMRAGAELALHGHTEAAHKLLDESFEFRQGVAGPGRLLRALAPGSHSASGRPDSERALAPRCRVQSPGHESQVPDTAKSISCLSTLGFIAAIDGDSVEAHRIADILEASAKPGDAVYSRRLFERARIAAVLNEREHAVSLLRRALAEGMAHPDLRLEGGLALAPLAGYPPFEELLKGSTF